MYNCHGMTFASRRTGIYDDQSLFVILHEDNYIEVEAKQVLPGDVILYISPDGDVEHSGVVVSRSQPPLFIPDVCSKWGKFAEIIHPANDCPYSFTRPKYYRVQP